MKRLFAFLLAAIMMVLDFTVAAETTVSSAAALPTMATNDKVTYFDYIKNLSPDAEDEIVLLNDSEVKLVTGDKESFEFDVTTDGSYIIEAVYNTKDSTDELEIAIKIDGEFYFEEISSVKMPRIWVNDGKVRTDKLGNESAPAQKLWDGYTKQYVTDPEGVSLEAYRFSLTAGKHNLEIEVLSGGLTLKTLMLTAPLKTVDYKTYKNDNLGKEKYNGKPVIIEAEDALYKTDKTLISKADNSDPSISPASAAKTVLNTIGFNSWNSSGEALSWDFNAPESGFYKIGFKYKQSEALNNISYRRILIDGETPFSEALAVPFDYTNGWKFTEFSKGEDAPYLIYLDKGEHTLTMSVTLSDVAEYYRRLEEIVNSLGDIYINISMITGESPDKNRDYDLFRQIPDLTEKLKNNRDSILALAKEMNASTEMSGSSMIAAMNSMARVLKSMIDNPYTAQRYLSDYYSNYTSVGGWLYDMKSMPLSLDRIILSSPDDVVEDKAGFFEKLFFGIKRFFSSFSAEYNTLGSVGKDGPTIKIWVNWGRDQAEILGNMITDDFTPESGINVKLEIVNAGIIKGILAGNPPDLSLHMARSEPVNLAMRDALYDLTKFDDYNEVCKRFSKTASVPYMYNGGVYALPDTQAFYVMYYRKDILDKLGIAVPRDWQEFIDATVTIQRNNMQVWLPYLKITTATTVNTGVGGLSLFPTLMHQSGLGMYNEEGTACTLGTTETLEVFKFWTDFYTQYKLPKEASFYNRFRIGTMPLGIESYTLYQTLVNAAPEIRENWDIAEIPGIRNADGTINNAIAGSGTGCSVIADTGNEKYAWEFLKWWTDAETQLKYSDRVETILGTLGRVASANVEAVSGMSWKREDLKVILSAWDKVEEVEEVPGSYYLTRAVDQAYWAVVNGTTTAKEALITWSKVADNEITRKIDEYKN